MSEKIEDSIVELLQNNKEEMFIAEIAKHLNLSSATVSKNLGILEAKGRVISRIRKPYKLYRAKGLLG